MELNNKNRIRGILLGTAVGDSVGLPAEGISRRRNKKLFKGQWYHRFLFRFGMLSDDTEHTIFVSQCLIKSPQQCSHFIKRLAWCLRLWFIALPAGIGLATLRSIFKLWIGFSPSKSGVFSAGNGPAMRAAPIGAFFASNQAQLDEYVTASTRITHTDPKALIGAKAVAYLTAWAVKDNLTDRPELEELLAVLRSIDPNNEEWEQIISDISQAVHDDLTVVEFAEKSGLEKGITGYIYHTIPVVIYAWYMHFGDFEMTLKAIFDCGGDTDTTGAIVGAMAGAVTGESGIPETWKKGILDWPRNTALLIRISDKLADNTSFSPGSPVRYFWPGIIIRNFVFLIIVLLHGFRRLLPPY